MSAKRLWVLLALAIAVAGGAYWLSTGTTLKRDPDYGARVLPGLAAALDAVSSVRLVGAGGQTLVTLTRDAGHWRVAEAGYPADAARVRRLPGWPTRRRWIVKDLAQFWYSTTQLPVSDEQRTRWLAEYAMVSGHDIPERVIAAKARRIAAHDVKLNRRQPKRHVSLEERRGLRTED